MIGVPTGVMDMRHGMNTLALQVQQNPGAIPMPGICMSSAVTEAISSRSYGTTVWGFRSTRSIWSGAGSRSRRRRAVRCQISVAQLGYLLEGVECRNPVRTWRPSRQQIYAPSTPGEKPSTKEPVRTEAEVRRSVLPASGDT